MSAVPSTVPRRAARRRAVDMVGTGLALACLVLALIPLGAMLVYIAFLALLHATRTTSPMFDARIAKVTREPSAAYCPSCNARHSARSASAADKRG